MGLILIGCSLMFYPSSVKVSAGPRNQDKPAKLMV